MAALALSWQTQAAQIPRGSFLVEPVQSVAQLTAQIRKTPQVAERYRTHFNLPTSQFVQYTQAQLGLRRLPHSGRYRVFFIKPDGRISSEVRRLRKGTLVFLHLQSGQPVLLGKCGNPLTARLPGYAPPRKVTATPPLVPQPPAAQPQEPVNLEPPVLTVATQSVEPPAPVPLQPVPLSPWAADPVLLPLAPQVPAENDTIAKRVGPIPVLLIALAGLTQLDNTSSNRPPIIPEPASVASLLIGTGLLVICQRWRRSRRP
ncbi:MAG: PEP-CTERM sorting domain-containing protein [Armatimonadota bacterium]